MKIRSLFFIVIFLFPQLIISQEYSREFGNISPEELKMEEYADDKDAEAVVLFDMGKSYFSESDKGYDVVFEKVTRIKIFSEAGLKWAEVEIPFYQEGGIFEKVSEIEACTYNYENGRLSKSTINKDAIYEEKINENWKAKKMALPDVKAGSVIEYKYTIRSQYVFNLRDWDFQWRIPVVYSEYVTKMIPFYTYTYILQGANKFSSTWSYKEGGLPRRFGLIEFTDIVYHYVMEKVPAFKEEEFISSINDYIIKLDFQLSEFNSPRGGTTKIMTTWPEMIKELLKHNDFGRYVKKCEKLADKLLNANHSENLSELEKFNLVMNYVKKNYNWNKRESKYASKSPNEVIKDKFGNCADINLLAVGLLNAMGIEANPMIMSTREHGKIKINFPFAHFFNYVLIQSKIDGKVVLADATAINIPNDRIPSRCINDAGLIIKNGEVNWISLACNFPSKIKTNVIIDSLGTDLSAQMSVSASEYDAFNLRTTYGDDKKKLKEKLEKDGYTVEESSIETANIKDLEKPYNVKFSFTKNAEYLNDKIYISPFFNETITEKPS
jgi:hypothetical protein